MPYELILASATMGPQGHVSKGGVAVRHRQHASLSGHEPERHVPTIDDDGFILWESNAILMWVALKHAPEVLWWRRGPASRAAVQWMSWTNARLEPLLHTLVMELVRLPEPERGPAKVERPAWRYEVAEDARSASRPPALRRRRQFHIGDIPIGAAVYRWLVFTCSGPICPTSSLAGPTRRAQGLPRACRFARLPSQRMSAAMLS